MPSPVSTSRRLSFGPFEADLQSGELRKKGQRIRLQAQPFQLLVMLLERPGELVTREEICQKLWSVDTHVDFDRSLGTAVNKIREVLGDSAEEPRFVETLPRRGYRFVGAVTPVSEPLKEVTTPSPILGQRDHPEKERSRSVIWVAASLVILVLAMIAWRWLRPRSVESIAVLPLASLSADPGQQFFAYGVTDELTTNLAQIASLRVSSHTSSVACSEKKKSASETARCLGVDALVEGSVVRSGDRVRLTAQLIRGTSDSHLWSHTYEIEASNILSAQGELAREIAESISAVVTPKERDQLSRSHPMKPEVADLYFRGSFALTNQRAVEARDLFLQATQLDPDSAEAWAGLADALHTIGVFGDRQAFPKAAEAADKALQLDPSQAQALMVLAIARGGYNWNPTEAEGYFRQAIAARPSYARAHALFGVVLAHQRRFKEGIDEIKLARSLDPFSIETNAFAWHVYFCARKYDEALAVTLAARQADPSFGPAHWRLYVSLEQKGEYEKALETADQSDPNIARLRSALASGGERGYWQQMLNNIPPSRRTGVGAATCYMHLGKREEALKALEESYQRRGEDVARWLPIRPEFDPLQSDPRFQRMLQGLGITRGLGPF